MQIDELIARYPDTFGKVSRRDLLRLASMGGFALAGGLAGAGALGSIAEVSAQDTPVAGGTFTLSLAGNPTAYPITAPGGVNDILVNKVLFNNLVQYQLVDNAIQVVGDLAESWEPNADLTQYTFKLKAGVTWHDGTPLTAADVVFTIESMLNPEVNASQAGNIASVKAVSAPDDATVVFDLNAPFADLPIMLGYNIGIVPKHLLEGQDLNEPTAFLQNPVGSGPFMFKSLSAGDFMEVARYDGYFGDKAFLDSIIFKIIPDGNARVAQVRGGEIDLTIIEPPAVDSLSDASNLAVREAPIVQYYFLAVNHTSPVMQDVKLRKALDTVLDKQAIIDQILKGYGSIATGPINPLLAEYYNPDVTTYPYDADAAGKLLDEAGWTKDGDARKNAAGETLSVTVCGPQGYPVLEQILIYTQQQFQSLGVGVDLQIDEWTVHLEKYRTQQYDLLLNWWTLPPAPDMFAHYHSTSAANWWKYNNPQVDELAVAGRAEPDQAKRIEIYKQLQTIVADDLPVLYLYYGRELQALANRVQDLPLLGYRDALSWSELIWIKA
jgi:peptide/nickel transport system substrate-binding protein